MDHMDAKLMRMKANAVAVKDHAEADARKIAALAKARMSEMDKRWMVGTAVAVGALTAGYLTYRWLRD